MPKFRRHSRAVLTPLLVTILWGCTSLATTQQVEPANTEPGQASTMLPGAATASAPLGEEVALRAIALVGKPYRYGGADLQGFDCSGMVYFIHQSLGLDVPRTAADQKQAAFSVDRSALQPGDLLFFRTTRSKRVSHVAIYVGDNRFVHAPQTGKLIELRTLDDQYYGPRLVGSGRLLPNS